MNFLVEVAQICTVPLIAYTLMVYLRQAKAMEKQLIIQERHLVHAEEIHAQSQFYQAISSLIEMRPQIEQVFLLKDKTFNNWSEKERESALCLVSQCHFIGVLVSENLINDALLAKTWPYNIKTCHKILQPFIEHIRHERGERYWWGFDFLTNRIQEISNVSE